MLNAVLQKRRGFGTALGVILFVAFVVRVAARAASGPTFFWKNSYIFYFDLAHSLATGHGYALPDGRATAFRVPFYALFVAGATRGTMDFWSLLIAQALVSTGTVACAAALAAQLFGRRAALVAGVLTAFYPYYLWHDTSLQETGLLTFLTVLAMVLLFAARRHGSVVLAAATGLVLGLDILTRSIVLPFALFAVVWLMLPGPTNGSTRRRFTAGALCLGLLVTTLSPWLVRNHDLTGRWTLSTEFGAAMFYGNNPQTFAFYPERSIDLSAAAARAALTPAETAAWNGLRNDEAGQSDWLMRRGLGYIIADPARFVIGAVRKNIAAFGVVPSPRHDWKTDLVQGGSYGLVLLLGVAGLWQTRRRWRDLLPVYAQFVLFAGITGVLWGHSSHRAFLDVYLIVFASHTLAILARPRSRREMVDRVGFEPT